MPTIAPVQPHDAPQFAAWRLLVMRKHRKLSQAQLARRIGRTPSLIAQFERGDRQPSAPVLGALSHVLRCAIDDLYAKPGPAEPPPVLPRAGEHAERMRRRAVREAQLAELAGIVAELAQELETTG